MTPEPCRVMGAPRGPNVRKILLGVTAGLALACGGGDADVTPVATGEAPLPAAGGVDLSTLGGNWREIQKEPWGWIQPEFGAPQCAGGTSEVTFDLATTSFRIAGGDNFDLVWRTTSVAGKALLLQTVSRNEPDSPYELEVKPAEPVGAIDVTLAGVTRTFGRDGAFPHQWVYCGGSPDLASLVGPWRELDVAKRCTRAGRIVVLEEGQRFELDGRTLNAEGTRFDIDDAGFATFVTFARDDGTTFEMRLQIPPDDERTLEMTDQREKKRYMREALLGTLGACP